MPRHLWRHIACPRGASVTLRWVYLLNRAITLVDRHCEWSATSSKAQYSQTPQLSVFLTPKHPNIVSNTQTRGLLLRTRRPMLLRWCTAATPTVKHRPIPTTDPIPPLHDPPVPLCPSPAFLRPPISLSRSPTRRSWNVFVSTAGSPRPTLRVAPRSPFVSSPITWEFRVCAALTLSRMRSPPHSRCLLVSLCSFGNQRTCGCGQVGSGRTPASFV